MEQLKQETIKLLEQHAIMLQLIHNGNIKVEEMIDVDNMFIIILKIRSYTILTIKYFVNLNEFLIKIHGLSRQDQFSCQDLSECDKFINMYFDHIKNYYLWLINL